MPATRCDPRLAFGPVPLVAAGTGLRFSLCAVLPTTPPATLFAPAPASLRPACTTFLCAAPVAVLVTRRSVAATRAAGLIVAAVLLSTTTGFRLRLLWLWLWLWLCLSPLPLSLPALLSAAAPLFAGPPFATPAPLFAGPRALRPFVAPTPLFRASGALPGMAPRATLPLGFLVGAGGRCARQGQRAADGDRTALSTPLSREAHHVPARLRAPGQARERS
jgi:hypothetical protein